MPRTKIFIDCIVVALIYILSARIGQLFAVEPGNVTPVWIPSGLMVALALYKGSHIWPGVFLGAFAGNIWAYFSSDTLLSAMAAIASASMNGIGDVICCVTMAHFILKHTQSNYPFTKIQDFLVYILFAVLLGPLISALMGVGGLTVFNFIENDKFIYIFITWFVGDATGAMIFGPLLLSWLFNESFDSPYQKTKLTALALFSIVLTASTFQIIAMPKVLDILWILLIPITLFTIMYNGQRSVFTVQALVSATAVYATSFNLGPFANKDSNQALLELQLFIASFSLIMFSIAVIVYRQQKASQELALKKEELENLYRQDQLTKTWNRYRITEFIEVELSRFQRNQRPFGVIMIDIDNFKAINDHYGHTEGDKVLVEISDLIKVHIREADLFGRWGGEEFIIVVTDTNKDSIMILAEKIRNIIIEHDFRLSIQLSISLGVTLSRPDDTIMNLVDRSDEALYRSKLAGKNKSSFSEFKS